MTERTIIPLIVAFVGVLMVTTSIALAGDIGKDGETAGMLLSMAVLFVGGTSGVALVGYAQTLSEDTTHD